MPVFNLTIPSISPLVTYSNGVWNDPPPASFHWANYTDGTLFASQDNGATASLTFNGSAVYAVGTKGTKHGEITVRLDGTSTTIQGAAPEDTLNSTLFGQSGLSSDIHQLTLQNTWSGSTPTWFGLEYIIVTSGDGNATTQSESVVMDDGDKNITYSSGWQTSPNGFQSHYYAKTMHRTNTEGSSATISFYGNAVTIYGATTANHGLFSISLDGNLLPDTFNGSAPSGVQLWQNILYYYGGLPTTQHSMTIQHADPDNTRWFDLDKVAVSTWPGFDDLSSDGTSNSGHGNNDGSGSGSSGSGGGNQNGSNSGSGGSGSGSGGKHQHNGHGGMNSGVTAAVIVLSVITAIALLSLAAFLLVRRRRLRQQRIYHEEQVPIEEVLTPRQLIIEPYKIRRENARLGNGRPMSLCSSVQSDSERGTDDKMIFPQSFALDATNQSERLPPPAYDQVEASFPQQYLGR